MTNDPVSAVSDFDVVLGLQSNNPHAFFGRGFAYKLIKEYFKSAEDFEKVTVTL